MIISHDLGTTGNKATLVDASGVVVAAVTVAYDTDFGSGGKAEQDPHEWWRALCEATRQLLAELRRIGYAGHPWQEDDASARLAEENRKAEEAAAAKEAEERAAQEAARAAAAAAPAREERAERSGSSTRTEDTRSAAAAPSTPRTPSSSGSSTSGSSSRSGSSTGSGSGSGGGRGSGGRLVRGHHYPAGL